MFKAEELVGLSRETSVPQEPWKQAVVRPRDGGPAVPCVGHNLPSSSGLRVRPSVEGSASSAGGNRCVAAAEACTADARCQGLRTEYVARCLGRAASGGCSRARCHRALRRFFARGPPALTLALLFCPCADPACAERRRQTFVPSCAFAEPGAFQASCAPAPVAPEGCSTPQTPRCWLAYAGLVGTIITPNYVDNVSARVAPWCDCAGTGNRREECEGFRGLFTRNLCLDRAIEAFESQWPPSLQDSQDLLQVPSSGWFLEGSWCLFMLPALALCPLL
ncbi:GDNF family receptor alpha-4 [Echinops telfairi]|uniref:GDNF family receptor alpha-4 n=1 Tax=Echinops telfairi TaxID=9371 RepID=A0AC55DIB2_ECHTE|nr:GDNF family receptor alpha-4 [Echinops telfairi]